MRIATIFGIPLYLDWSWFIFMIILIVISEPTSILVFLGAFLFVVLHEYGHCFAARYYSLEVADVTLYPIGGIARILDFDGKKPMQELVIALAGPLVNFAICAITFLIPITENAVIDSIIKYAFILNLYIGAFNLFIPIFPMDGGRILRSILQAITGNYELATTIAVRAGQAMACGLFLVGMATGNFFLAIIFVLIGLGAQAELLQVRRTVSLEKLKVYLATIGMPEPKYEDLPQVVAAIRDMKDEDLKQRLTEDGILSIFKEELAENKMDSGS